jgi:hypothetical protein
VCSERKRSNRIGRIAKENGGWVEEEGEKKEFIANHFFSNFSDWVRGVTRGLHSSSLTLCSPESQLK